MQVDALKRYERPACELCNVMAPECELPVGDGSKAVCWLCAHDATEHADGSKCECEPAAVYPAHVIARRTPLVDVTHTPEAQAAVKLAPRRVTLHNFTYGRDGRRDPNGPKIVQELEEVSPGVLRVVRTTVRECTSHEKQVNRLRFKGLRE